VNATFGPVRQIDAGPLNVGYVEVGPPNGQPVVLLHGWPYDIHSYADAAPALADAGYRVVVPFLRGFGTTRFRSADTVRTGQQSALAVDVLDLMDALGIESAIIAGFDWGARSANVVAALWPHRCRAMVSVSGYLIGNPKANKTPLPPAAELSWWYQFYFATDRGPGRLRPVPPRLREAHLAHRVTEVELRQRDLRTQRRLLQQPRPRRHRDPQLSVAARPSSRGGPVRRNGETTRGESGHHGAHHHPRR
jgi:pimeloyl-ACP methyl ester carboxylesterase